MTLGEYIMEYCNQHGLSQRQFATQCDLSNGYISMLISGVNPKTGKQIKPAIDSYIKLADGMGITLNELFEAIDDTPVVLPGSKIVSEDEELWQIREDFRRNPELRTIHSLTRNATRQELRQVEAFIRAIRSSNDENTD